MWLMIIIIKKDKQIQNDSGCKRRVFGAPMSNVIVAFHEAFAFSIAKPNGKALSLFSRKAASNLILIAQNFVCTINQWI